MEKKTIKDYPDIERQVKAIKEFARQMGYTTEEKYYDTHQYYLYDKDFKSRPVYFICLCETGDCEGNPYSWSWLMDTGEMI